jgi:hypothetical protein
MTSPLNCSGPAGDAQSQPPQPLPQPQKSSSKLPAIAGGIVAAAVAFMVVNWLMNPGEPTTFATAEDDRKTFSVDLPTGYKFKVQPLEARTPAGNMVRFRMHIAESPQYALAVLICDTDINEYRQGRSDEQIANDMITSSMGNVGISATNIQQVTRGTHTVWRSAGSGQTKGIDMDGLAEAYILPKHTCMVYVIAKKGAVEKSKAIPRFFETFKVNE